MSFNQHGAVFMAIMINLITENLITWYMDSYRIMSRAMLQRYVAPWVSKSFAVTFHAADMIYAISSCEAISYMNIYLSCYTVCGLLKRTGCQGNQNIGFGLVLNTIFFLGAVNTLVIVWCYIWLSYHTIYRIHGYGIHTIILCTKSQEHSSHVIHYAAKTWNPVSPHVIPRTVLRATSLAYHWELMSFRSLRLFMRSSCHVLLS